MTMSTALSLEAALIDQKVAGIFHGRAYAFVTDGWKLGVAVENEAGYHPIEGKTFPNMTEAQRWADDLNRHIGLTKEREIAIVSSTMRKERRK